MPKRQVDEIRDGVELTSLDQPVLNISGSISAEPTKRQLVDYLDRVSDVMLPALADRALSVIRVRPGQQPFMQKNLPDYAPDWIPRVDQWSQASRRLVHYPVCGDRRTLLWLANQRSVEFHPALVDISGRQAELIIDLDPPEGSGFSVVVSVAAVVRDVLAGCGLSATVKTSGSKGVHIVVPVAAGQAVEDIAAATRALAARTARADPEHATVAYVKDDREGKVFVDSTRAGGATVAAAYSPRIRPGLPVSWPLSWDELPTVQPGDFTVTSVLEQLDDRLCWNDLLPGPQELPADLVAEGHRIPVARVAAMHEGKRRKRKETS